VSPGLAELLRDAVRLVNHLDIFPAQLIADPSQATLVGVVDEGRLGSMPPVGPDLSLILVSRHESPIVPPPSNDVTMQGEFSSSVGWVAAIVERTEQGRRRRTGLSLRLSYVPTSELLQDPAGPRERQTGAALVPRVQVSGRAGHRAEFAAFMRAAKSLTYVGQEIQPQEAGTFVTTMGFTTLIFSRTGQVPDSGREVLVGPTPSEVVLRNSGSGAVIEPSPRLR
jgi:hypothetical protein